MRGSPNIRNINRKLTEDDVRLIRELLAERDRHIEAARKLSAAVIAEKFDIAEVTVQRLATYHDKRWARVKVAA